MWTNERAKKRLMHVTDINRSKYTNKSPLKPKSKLSNYLPIFVVVLVVVTILAAKKGFWRMLKLGKINKVNVNRSFSMIRCGLFLVRLIRKIQSKSMKMLCYLKFDYSIAGKNSLAQEDAVTLFSISLNLWLFRWVLAKFYPESLIFFLSH